MKTLFSMGGLIVLCALAEVTIASAARSPYLLDMRVMKNEHNTKILRLKNKESGRVLWTRKIYRPTITWAQNRRALAVAGGKRSILVWREGYRLRDLALPDGGDYAMGCAWSPDNNRLLILASKSSGGEVGVGALFCLRLGEWPHYHYALVAPEVAEMGWRDNQTVFYRRLNWKTMLAEKKSYLWRVSR